MVQYILEFQLQKFANDWLYFQFCAKLAKIVTMKRWKRSLMPIYLPQDGSFLIQLAQVIVRLPSASK